MRERARILVVDDEEGIRELIKDALSLSGFEVVDAPDGLAALAKIRNEGFDLLILDINMPKLDGFALLEKIRTSEIHIPVLMLSARGDKADVTRGLKLGADDYVTKPFGLEELVLRVRAILKRTKKETEENLVLQCGPIGLDEDHHLVTLHEERIELSPTEFRLLHFLMLRNGMVVTKEVLLEAIWDMGFAKDSTVVDTYISYLRKKLHKNGFDGIKTVRGIGFQLLSK